MADSGLPRWLAQVDEAIASRAVGVILLRNTSDRVMLPNGQLPLAYLKYALAHHLTARGLAVGCFAPGLGFEPLVPPGAPQGPAQAAFREVPAATADPALALAAIGRLLRRPSPRAAVLLDYADHLVPVPTGTPATLTLSQLTAIQRIHAWGQDDAIRETRNLVVLISYEDRIHPLVLESSGYRAISLDLPDEAAREAMVRYLLEIRAQGYAGALGTLADGFTTGQFARHASGLRLTDIEWLLRVSAARQAPVTRGDLRREKQHAIAQLSRGLVEVVEPQIGFEGVAGAKHAKAFFNLIRNQWTERTPSCPQAVLLAGVPGCGKSHIVKAVAREFNAPLIVMRNVRDPFVGQSERNLERVLWIAENLSPCILWTDELDQAIGQRGTGPSGDSGTSERMLARLFEYFGGMDKRGRILWIGTSNRPDLLDPALLDRFQVVVPWLHPTEAERAELIPLLAGQVGRVLAPGVVPGDVASMAQLDTLTIRSLQEIIVAAGLRADTRTGAVGTPVERKDLLAAVDDYKPPYDPVEHEFLALKAVQMATFHSLLPWAGRDAGVPGYLRSLIDQASGRLIPEALSARIAQLEDLRMEHRIRR